MNISRREADKLIEKKEVKINGNITKLGEIVLDKDIVSYKNKIINPVDVHEYYKFYKPKNYVSSRSRQGNSKTIYDLIKNKKLLVEVVSLRFLRIILFMFFMVLQKKVKVY